MIAATYIINLAASDVRWATLQPVLTAMAVPRLIRFDAIDGATLDVAAAQAAGTLATDLGGFDAKCARGEIGCALSHRAVLADIVAQKLPAALILEDDILLAGAAADWPARYAAAFADLPRGWEMWYLYRCLDVEHRVRRISPRTVVPWTPQGGAAYAVTLTGARKLLAALDTMTTAVDRVYAPLVQCRGIVAYAASPLLVVPGEHASVINRDNPAKGWVENGINRPPEYWPDEYLAHLGEAVPPPARWRRVLNRFAR